MTLAPAPTPVRRFETARQWIDALGNVPLERVIFDPSPGHATVEDQFELEKQGRLVELIDDTLVEKAVGFWEERVAQKLSTRLDIFADDHELGIVNNAAAMMYTDGGDLRAPDVTFTSKARIPSDREARPILSPDLIVEVLSPGNTPGEIDRKLRDFFAGGTRLAWVIDPRTRSVAVHRGEVGPAAVLHEAEVLNGDDVLPGFTLPIATLLADHGGA
jgi:Uma2 family endonuclease